MQQKLLNLLENFLNFNEERQEESMEKEVKKKVVAKEKGLGSILWKGFMENF